LYTKNDLAVNGGNKARTKPETPMFPGGMAIGIEEEQAVLEVLRSRRLFRYYGPYDTESKVEAFENAYAKQAGSKYCLALNSCSNALTAALIAVGVQPGDEVIVPGYTFVASAAAIVAANAIPVICEIDDTLTMDPNDIERNITSKTKVIMPVHMRGASCQMDEIMAVAKRHGLKVVEDAAQSNGGSYKGKKIGTIGDAGCFSLQYHKIITCGEGGVIVTDDKNVYVRAMSFHDTGANWRDADIRHEDVPFPGMNMRMTELQGALALVQLGRREKLINTMRGHKRRIKEAMSRYGITFRRMADESGELALTIVFFLPDKEKAAEIVKALHAEGIVAGSQRLPDWHVYTSWDHILNRRGNNDSGFPFTLSDRTYDKNMCPKTLDYLFKGVHIAINPAWTDADVSEIIAGIEKVFSVML